MITTEKLTMRFDDVVAVDHLDVTFGPGITGLVGQNGAGKSTLLRLIAGIYHPSEGKACVDGHPSETKEAKSEVFFLPDDPYAPRGATIKGMLDFYQGLFELDADKFDSLIQRFGLPMNKAMSRFSKGMRRQAFIALALSMKARHLLLDEAFDGLDPLVVDSIKEEIIANAESGKTIVISSHNIFALQSLVDRFLILSSGGIAKEEEADAMGQEFVKFQAAFNAPINEGVLKEIGFNVVSFRKVGSVYHFVILGGKTSQQLIEERLHPLFIDSVPLGPEEVISLQMMLAKREGGNENA